MDDNTSIQFRLRLAQINGVTRDDQINEAGSRFEWEKPARDEDRTATMKTYFSSLAKHAHLPGLAAHQAAAADASDKHGRANVRQHVEKNFYGHHMMPHLKDAE